jgi:hypothetical protein
MGKQHQNLFQQGTAPWSIKRFKEVTLTRWLADLAALEKDGLQPNDCDKVTEALRVISTLLSGINDESLFYKSMWQEFKELEDLYERWNTGRFDPEANKTRKEFHQRMLVHRKKMWKRAWGRFNKAIEIKNNAERDTQLDLIADIDKQVADDIYSVFRNLTKTYPTFFPLLNKELNEYDSKFMN